MDVTCPRCATEYEFDAALVGRRGTTVKCTTCEHLFQVMPPADEVRRPWLVRRADGAAWELGSLKDLQVAISRGELGPADTLSRGDGVFRPLGAIAELTSLFAGARSSERARSDTVLDSLPPAARPVRLTSTRATLAGVGRPGLASPKSTLSGVGESVRPAAIPPPGRAPSPASPPSPVAPELPSLAPPPASSPPRRAKERLPETLPESVLEQEDAASLFGTPSRPPNPIEPPGTPTIGPGAGKSTPRPRRRAGYGRRAPKLAAAASDTSPRLRHRRALRVPATDPAPAMRKRRLGNLRRFALGVGLVSLAAGVTFALLSQLRSPEAPPEAAAALAEATAAGYARAAELYREAGPDDPELRAREGWAHALASAVAVTQASDRRNRATEPLPRDRAGARHRASALERAGALEARGEKADAALLRALALLEDPTEARQALALAREAPDVSRARLALVEAFLAPTPAERLAAAARARAAAAEAEGELDASVGREASLLAARAAQAASDREGAKRMLDVVLRDAPDHPRATALRARLEAAAPAAEPPSPPSAVPSAVPEDVRAEPRSETASGSPRRRAVPAELAAGESSAPSLSSLLRQGEDRLARGDTAGAEAAFEEALSRRPGAAPALTGLGFVALARGDAGEAARRFRPAHRADHGPAYLGLAEAYERLGRRADAEALYRAYLSSRPRGARAAAAQRGLRRVTERTEMSGSPAPL